MIFDKNQTYFLAGATGTEIQRRGFPTTLPLWSAEILFTKPEILTDIYVDYINAGADIITTNTFRTQRRTLDQAGRAEETGRINHLAVELAEMARNQANADRPIYIAGCLTTLEDCYRPDLVPSNETLVLEHMEQAEILKKTNIDFFLLETFNTIREAEIALAAATKTGKPAAVSFTVRRDGRILSGETWARAVEAVKKFSPIAILINCAPPKAATHALGFLQHNAGNIPTGVYANGTGAAGSPEGWDFSLAGSPAYAYASYCQEWKKLGANIIGGCCGTSPEYTKQYTAI